MRPDDTVFLRSVGRRIAELRSQLGMTQEEFAACYGASVKYIQQVEGGRSNLSLLTLKRFATLLSADVSELLASPASMTPNRGRPRKATSPEMDQPSGRPVRKRQRRKLRE